MKKQTLSVPSISCQHCKASIEQALGATAGVGTVTVDVAARRVEVSFDSDRVTPAQIAAAVVDLGHEVAD